MHHSYGIDVGGTKIELKVYDQDFVCIDSARVSTPKADYSQFLDTIFHLTKQADADFECIGSLGVGVPCRFDEFGRSSSVNVPCLNGPKLAEDLQQLLGRPVAVENDSRSFALSESFLGGASGFQRSMGLILGTGVAGGLVISGELYSGKQGVCGEYGHVPIGATIAQRYSLPLRSCPCGLIGCYEQYLSGPGLLWLANSMGGGFDSVPEIAKSIEASEQLPLEVLDVYQNILACFLAQLTLFYDPDVIVVGGGLSNIPTLYENLSDITAQYLLPGAKLPLLSPPKFGDASGARGMAILGRQVFQLSK